MPHAIYLHSALTKGRMPVRDDAERARVLRFERTDVIVALGLAGLVNMAMLAVAAKLFHDRPGYSTRQHDPAGPRRLRPPRRRHRRARLRRRPARLRRLLLERRHLRRPGRHGRLRQPPHPALPPPRHHHDPRASSCSPSASAPRARSSSARSSSPSASPSPSSRSLLLTRRRDVMGIHVNRRADHRGRRRDRRPHRRPQRLPARADLRPRLAR